MAMIRHSSLLVWILWAAARSQTPPAVFNVQTYGAPGDGKTLATSGINKAIDAASATGGGKVYFPPGTYLSGSIHLKSHITLYLEQGSTLLATDEPTAYDEAEPNQWDQYQDFGHSHFR